MNGYLLSFCLILMKSSHGDGHLPCPTDDSSSFNAWLCGLNDWMDSMAEWKHRIEQYCSDEDLGTGWKELFSCSDRITPTCCDETMERCEGSNLNCTICYCTDGRYTNRQHYQQLWRKHQTDFQTALRMYDEKMRYCGRGRSECDETTSTTEKPETENTTEVSQSTTYIHSENVTTQPMEGSGEPTEPANDTAVMRNVTTHVRLRGTTDNNRGRVEVFYNGEWGTVCDDFWTSTESDVICRMLGFGDSTATHLGAHYGPGTGRIWLDNVRCADDDYDIANCEHNGWGIQNCGHSEDVGVDCA